jgi:hypothetical protein
MDGMGVRIQAVAREFSRLHNVELGCLAHLFSYSVHTDVLSPGVKRPGLEVDHSPPSIAEFENKWRSFPGGKAIWA